MTQVRPADRLLNLEHSAWVELDAEVAKLKPLDFSKGCPDYLVNRSLLDNLRQLTTSDVPPLMHQYTRPAGHLRLVNALGKLFEPRFRLDAKLHAEIPKDLVESTFGTDRSLNPLTEMIISVGSDGSLSTACLALINPGDEVLVMDPVLDYYRQQIEAAGGTPVRVPFQPPQFAEKELSICDFKIDWKDLESKISKKTKMLIVNSPSNSMGKVLLPEELQHIANLCIQYNLLCLADEGYEYCVFPPSKHHKIASFPGMWERTLTIGSVDKALGLTGWNLGWTVGPVRYITAMQMIQQNTIFTCPTPLQEAAAITIEDEISRLNTSESFFVFNCLDVMRKRDRLAEALKNVGFVPIIPQGGFFMLVNIEHVEIPKQERDERPRDVVFNKWMMLNKGIAGVPCSPFCSTNYRSFVENYLRFCIVKDDRSIDKFIEILNNW